MNSTEEEVKRRKLEEVRRVTLWNILLPVTAGQSNVLGNETHTGQTRVSNAFMMKALLTRVWPVSNYTYRLVTEACMCMCVLCIVCNHVLRVAPGSLYERYQYGTVACMAVSTLPSINR